MIDTGADVVALGRDDARRAGIDVDALRFDRIARTAAGEIRYAGVTMPEIRLAGIVQSGVAGAVLDRAEAPALLGGSFLARLGRISIGDDRMRLTP